MSQIATLTEYNHVYELVLKGGLNLGDAKLALVTEDYIPDDDHTSWDDVSAYETSGDGYTSGGLSISGSFTPGSGDCLFDAGDLTFPALSASFAYGIAYSGTNLLFRVEFNGGDNIDVEAYDFKVIWNEAGIVKAN